MLGKLYVCPTPIGNLEDITYRTVRILNEVDLILAEDTRHTVKLLNHFGIKKPLYSYHEHNKYEKENAIVEKLLAGENLAIVSDAGMPGISDPGEDIIRACIKNEIEVVGLPGPTASLLALVLSGLDTKKFIFEGFLSNKKSERRKELKLLKYEKRTLILYESPHRILKLLDDMIDILGNRKIALARELTKKYEEIKRGSIEEVIEYYKDREIKGEIVVVIEGSKEEEIVEYDMTAEEQLKIYMDSGMTRKDAVKKISKERDLPKNELYKMSLNI